MIYIIIVTYNGDYWIEKCLNNLINSEFKQSNVVIVDNCSVDNTLNIVEQKFPEINLIKLKKNVGFGKANNIGIKFALKNSIEYVFLLNQDVYINPETINKLIIAHKKNRIYGIISPIHLNGKGDKLDASFSEYLSYKNNSCFFSDHVLKRKKLIYTIPFVNAASWLVPKNVLDEIGGFNPLFFHYGEDTDYCNRVIYHKYKIGVITDAFILHDRENRQKIEIKLFSKEYYQYMDRKYKIEFGNINMSFSIKTITKKIFKLIIRATLNLLIMRKKFFIGYLKESWLIISNIKKIKRLRVLLEKKGSHFL